MIFDYLACQVAHLVGKLVAVGHLSPAEVCELHTELTHGKSDSRDGTEISPLTTPLASSSWCLWYLALSQAVRPAAACPQAAS